MKVDGKQAPFCFGFEFKEPNYFELDEKLNAKVFKYVQDRKRGIQNAKIEVDE